MATGSCSFIFTVGLVILIHTRVDIVTADCSTDLKNIGQTYLINLQEKTLAGTVLLKLTDDYNHLTPATFQTDFVTITNGSLTAKINMTLDGPENQEICTKSTGVINPSDFSCVGAPNIRTTVLFLFNYTRDYGPYFITSEININESTAVGTTVANLANIVADNDCSRTLNYIFDGESKSLLSVEVGKLVLRQSLDYEIQKEYFINLTVISNIQGISDYASNTTTLTVHVLDIDDMNPVFDIGQFRLQVPEVENVSSTWYKTTPPIEARDGDTGINTSLTYSISSVAPSLQVQINNETGEIQVLEQLDRETTPVYVLVVKAAQVDLAYRTAIATLTLLVGDVNDNRPVFTSPTQASLQEDAANGSLVMELTGEDLDEGDNSVFDFFIVGDNLGAFATQRQPTTNRTYLVVRNNTALRGQLQGVVQLYLHERLPSVGTPCSNTTTCYGRITVDIIDVNDNSPQFQAGSYYFTVPSNTGGSHAIGTVHAEDADRGDNAVVRYTSKLISSPSECSGVQLDTVSGQLTAAHLQLPAGATCSWIVTGCDSPADLNSRRCSSVPLTVTVIHSGNILEVNVTLPENVPIGTTVLSLPIKGLHTGPEFEIRNEVLYTNVSLDREQQDSYQVALTSVQNTSSPLMNVYVIVSDVNDNAPVFGQSVYVLNLNSSWELNQTVLTVSANDADTGDNARMNFSMVTGREYFEIDARSGEIQLIAFPTANNTEYQLLVTDFGQPSLSNLATLKVYSSMHIEIAYIILPVGKDKLMADIDGVARKLMSILEVSVRINNIESLGPVPELGSKVYISATTAQGESLSATELNKLLDKNAMQIYSEFAAVSKPADTDKNSHQGFSDLEIVLICLVPVLALLLILLGFFWYRSHKKLRQNRRLFDSLNKDTAIYDNPRKSSSSGAAMSSSNNNNSTNAQRLMARLSSGSLGHSSVTNLLPAQSDGNNSQSSTPPGSSGSQRRQNHVYENVVNSSISGRDIYLEDVVPVMTSDEHITKFTSQIADDGDDSAGTAQPHVTVVDSKIPRNDFVPSSFSGRQSSEVDSCTISDKENQLDDADEEDQEVANILSDSNPNTLTHTLEDNTDCQVRKSNLDLMTAPTKVEEANLEGHENPSFDDTENLDTNVPPEPEPDYAKKVRFSEATATMNEAEAKNNPETNNKDMSLAKFLSQYGGVENLATNTDTAQDSTEEITAL